MIALLARTELDPYDVSPGLLGFAVSFAVAVALIGLLVSMNRKIRGVTYRDRMRDSVSDPQGPSGDAQDAPGDHPADPGSDLPPTDQGRT